MFTRHLLLQALITYLVNWQAPLYLLDLLLLIVIFSSSDSGRSKRALMIWAQYCIGLNSEFAGMLDQQWYQTTTDTCGTMVSNVNTVRTLQSNQGLMANQFFHSLLIFRPFAPEAGVSRICIENITLHYSSCGATLVIVVVIVIR